MPAPLPLKPEGSTKPTFAELLRRGASAPAAPRARMAPWKFWLLIGVVSIPIWLFLAGFGYVESYLHAGDHDAAGALGMIVAIVLMPAAAGSAVIALVLLANRYLLRR